MEEEEEEEGWEEGGERMGERAGMSSRGPLRCLRLCVVGWMWGM